MLHAESVRVRESPVHDVEAVARKCPKSRQSSMLHISRLRVSCGKSPHRPPVEHQGGGRVDAGGQYGKRVNTRAAPASSEESAPDSN